MNSEKLKSYFDLCLLSAVTSYSTISSAKPIIKTIPKQEWDLLVSIVAFRVCIENLKRTSLTLEEQQAIFTSDCQRFNKKFPEFMQGLNTLIKVSNQNPGEDISEKIGLWIGVNLFQKSPSDLSRDELEAGILTTKLLISLIHEE